LVFREGYRLEESALRSRKRASAPEGIRLPYPAPKAKSPPSGGFLAFREWYRLCLKLHIIMWYNQTSTQ